MLRKMDLEINAVPIVSDAAIASSDWGDSRLIPVLVVNCAKNQGLSDLIVIHKDTPPGDVVSTWALKLFNKKFVYLILEFENPMPITAVVPFEISKHAHLIDGVIQAKALYLQEADTDKKSTVEEKIQKEKILVEIPSRTTFPQWNKLFLQAMTNKFQNSTTAKKEAREKAKLHIQETRRIWSIRKKA
jgi:hypothetical protein